MYVIPADDDPVLFGDLFSSEWIFDAWLEEDAMRLGPFTAKGGHTGYGAHAATEASNFVLAHGRVPLAALLLNDDCYAETVLARYGSGRLVFAPVFALPTDPNERRAQLNTRAFGRFPLPPAAEFAGGVADLRCAFGVEITSKAAASRLPESRTLRLDPRMQAALEARWGAHAARRGPVVARSVREKLETLVGADEAASAASAVEKLLARTWAAEGAMPDLIDTAVETGGDVGQLVVDLLEHAEAVEATASTAVEQLKLLAAAVAP